METGKYYYTNQQKVKLLKEVDWNVALAKCKKHIKYRLKQRTLSGAHSASNLGADPVDHYIGIAYEKILTGEWEWKDQRTLAQQMIRIADSYISKEVEKAESAKGKAFKVEYIDDEEEFYNTLPQPTEEKEQREMDQRLKDIETAIAGDEELGFMIEALKEGKKRSEIADLLGVGVRQFDKLKEKLMRRVQKQKQSSTT